MATIVVVACSKEAPADQDPSSAPPGPGRTPAPCLQVGLGKDNVRIGATAEIALTADAELAARFRERAGRCLGTVEVRMASEARYGDLLDVIDAARLAGFKDIAIIDGAGGATARPAPSTPDEAVPTIEITRTTIKIGDRSLAFTVPDLTNEVEVALRKIPVGPARSRVVILQADKATSGETILKVIKGANLAGRSEIILATKSL